MTLAVDRAVKPQHKQTNIIFSQAHHKLGTCFYSNGFDARLVFPMSVKHGTEVLFVCVGFYAIATVFQSYNGGQLT